MFTFLKTVLNDNPSLLKLNFYFGLDFPFDFSLDFPLADWSASGTPSQIAKGMVSSPNCLELLYIFKIMSWRDKEKYLGLLNQFPQRDWDELHRCFSMSRCLKVTGCRQAVAGDNISRPQENILVHISSSHPLWPCTNRLWLLHLCHGRWIIKLIHMQDTEQTSTKDWYK